jgi:hypothetical protein
MSYPPNIERREPFVDRFYDAVRQAEEEIRAAREERAAELNGIVSALDGMCVDTDVVVDVLRVLLKGARASRMVSSNDLDALDEAIGYIGGIEP